MDFAEVENVLRRILSLLRRYNCTIGYHEPDTFKKEVLEFIPRNGFGSAPGSRAESAVAMASDSTEPLRE